MYPMQWFWAPQVHLPWSGGVAQQIGLRPWFQAIPASAGDGELEQRAFETASYGRQLGWLTEVLLDIAKVAAPTTDEGKASLAKLVKTAEAIQALKDNRDGADGAPTEQQIEDYLRRLKDSDGARYEQVCARLQLAPLKPALKVAPA